MSQSNVVHLSRALTEVFFFFSSRRRHTRFKCDWSSDVCSSDLIDVFAKGIEDFLSSGAYVIESRILNEIYSSYGSENSVNFNVAMFEEPDFANQVRTAI